MTYDEMIANLEQAEEYLKDTTQGYKNHKPSWYQATTTHWYKGLTAIDEVIAELRKRRTQIVISLAGTTQVGYKITATVVCQ